MPDFVVSSSREFVKHETLLLRLPVEVHKDTCSKVSRVMQEQEAYTQKCSTRTSSSSGGSGLLAP